LLDTKTRTHAHFDEGWGTLIGGYPDMIQSTHHALRDIIVVATNQPDQPTKFYWFPAGGDGKVRHVAALTLPHANWGGGTLVDVPALGCMIFWTRATPQKYYEIRVPADASQPWTVTEKVITGVDMASVKQATSVYKRMDYAPQLKSLVWVTGNSTNEEDFGNGVVCIRVH
jgi:hypothetical protein